MPKITRLIPLLCLALLLSACSGDIAPPAGSEQRLEAEIPLSTGGPLYPILAPDLQAGASIYVEECAPCHGLQGGGDGPQASQLTVAAAELNAPETARHATLAEWYTLVSQGDLERFMPPFTHLTDRQKWDVAAYAYTLSVSPEMLTQGQALYAQNCAACHGESGRGDGPQAAELSARPANLAAQARMANQSDADLVATISSGVGLVMPGYAEQLSEAERWALAGFVRTFSFAAASTASAYPEPQGTPTAAPPPPGTGSVLVQVVNGSGGELPADTPVMLYGLDGMTLVFSQTLQTGVDGLYTFSEVEMPAGRAFLAMAEHAGEVYGSGVAEAGAVPADFLLQVVVYDTSTDASVLTVDRIHILIEFLDARNIQVVEVFTISNPTNRVVVAEAEGGPVAVFSLPEGATNLQFQDSVLGERYLEVPGGFADTSPVEPGLAGYQVVFVFEMPYKRKLQFAQPVNMTTNGLLVLLPDAGVKLSGNLTQEEDLREFQGTQYRVYQGGGISAGGQLTFDLSGSPRLGSPFQLTPETIRNLAIGLVTFGLAMIVAGVGLFSRSRAAEAGHALPVTEALPDDPDLLMDAIIALDDLHQAGKLPDEEYQSRRTALKERLKSRLGQ